MPEYLYRCQKRHSLSMTHGMMEIFIGMCLKCKQKMHRVPQVANVVWNGLPPHLETGRPPVIQNFIDTANERRAKYQDTEKDK